MSKMTPDEFWSILHSIPDSDPVFFRLYYNNDGSPNCYSMEDLPGNYIDVDAETFATRLQNVRVVNQQLVHIRPKTLVKKLVPSDTGTACDPQDVCVIVADKQPHTKWKIVNNEIN
jgi:hypothetical protein